MARTPASETLDGGRREAILAAALQCFSEVGVEATSIGDIGARSGASVGSIYHHFGNKEGIARALFVEGLRRNAALVEQRLQKAGDAEAGVRALVRATGDWIVANPAWARYIYMVSSNPFAVDVGDGLREVNRRYGEMIEACFGPHLAAGAFRRLPQECFASLVLGPLHDYARRWLNGQVERPPNEHAALFAAAAWQLVRSDAS